MSTNDVQAQSVFGMISRNARLRPDAQALSYGDVSWTYSELVAVANRLAGGLLASGVRKGDVIAIVAPTRPETIVTWLAAARFGAVPAVVNPAFTETELNSLFSYLGPRIVVTDVANQRAVANAASAVGALPAIVYPSDERPPDAPSINWPELAMHEPTDAPLPSGSDIVEMAFTSGTSGGSPKAAVFTNSAHIHTQLTQVHHLRLVPTDVCYCSVPLFHASGMRAATLPTLFAGGHLVLVDRFSAGSFWADVRRLRVTFTTIVETMALFLERQPRDPQDRDHSLRFISTNGTPDMLKQFEDRFGVRCVTSYASTEFLYVSLTSLDIAIEELQAARYHPLGYTYCGTVVDGVDVSVVDAAGNTVDNGTLGELAVRSAGALNRYHNDEQRTRERIVDGWVRLSDMGVLEDDGTVYYAGRSNDIIKRSGELISPLELEDAIDSHPAVRIAAVIGVPDELRQEEVKVIVVLEDDAHLTPEEIWSWYAEKVAPYKVPRYVEFRDHLPIGPSGKILRSALRLDLHEPAQVADRQGTSA